MFAVVETGIAVLRNTVSGIFCCASESWAFHALVFHTPPSPYPHPTHTQPTPTHPHPTGPGSGFTVNFPFPEKGATASDYQAAFRFVVLPILKDFNPDLIIISAGYDAAEHDPLGGMQLKPPAYAEMTRQLMRVGNGKVVAALEVRNNDKREKELCHSRFAVVSMCCERGWGLIEGLFSALTRVCACAASLLSCNVCAFASGKCH